MYNRYIDREIYVYAYIYKLPEHVSPFSSQFPLIHFRQYLPRVWLFHLVPSIVCFIDYRY